MAEFIVGMDGSGGYGVTEHSFKRVLPGDLESVRERLIYALERLNYRVLSEQPLHAKRGGGISFSILKCSIKLTIALRPLSAASTLATFDYEVKVSFATNGDRQTLEREAEAIIALAAVREAASVCAACGTNSTSDSRFCRACGAPNAGGASAELEVLRLTEGARVGHQTIITGVIMLVTLLAMTIPMILFGKPKLVGLGWVLLVLGQIASWIMLLYGMLRLHRTLNPKKAAQQTPPLGFPQGIPPIETAALPPQSARASITEGTTELLDSQRRERVPINHKS